MAEGVVTCGVHQTGLLKIGQRYPKLINQARKQRPGA